MNDQLPIAETPVPDGICVSCESESATTTCDSPTHTCAICQRCRDMLDGLEYEDDTQTPAGGSRNAETEELGGTESAPTPHIVPPAGTTASA